MASPSRGIVARAIFGVEGGIASSVYGTVLVMATLTAASSERDHPWRLVAIVAVGALVFWVAHLYAHALSESIELGRRILLPDLKRIARRELGIVLAAVPATAALVLGALGVVSMATALWLALGTGVAMLDAQGLRYARVEHFERSDRIRAVACNVALGLIVVGLKALLVH